MHSPLYRDRPHDLFADRFFFEQYLNSGIDLQPIYRVAIDRSKRTSLAAATVNIPLAAVTGIIRHDAKKNWFLIGRNLDLHIFLMPDQLTTP